MAEDLASEPRYLAFFEEFNQQRFYEAHEVLETLWLPLRQGADGAFYKGLIQVAGAFVHLQKDRARPAIALLRLARNNLKGYPAQHRRVDVRRVEELIQKWLSALEEAGFNPLRFGPPPRLELPPRGK